MGMSCTAEQSKTMEMLFKAEHSQAKWGEAGTYALDGAIPNRDYGYAPHINIRIQILLMADKGHAYTAGYAVIAPDGKFSMPAKVRKAMNL